MKTPEDEAFDELARRQGAWGGGFPAKRQMAADKLQEFCTCHETHPMECQGCRASRLAQPAKEPVSFPCCGYTDANAIRWNQFNGVVQCHMCGQVYTVAQPAQEPTSGDYALGYAEGFNDACKKPAQEPVALVIDGVLVKSTLPEKYTGHLYTISLQPAQKPEREALKLALEAYLCREMPAGTVIGDPKWWAAKIANAIKAALAQPEQKPVAWRRREVGGCWQYFGWEETGMTYQVVERWNKNGFECEAIPASPPQPAQKPAFGWIKQSELAQARLYGGSVNLWLEKYDCDFPVYTAPPQPEQKPATYSAWGLMGGDEFVNKDSLNRNIT